MIKWIGQHIWDFVSRFRNDIYITNKDTGNEHKITTSTNAVDVVVPSALSSLGSVRFLNEFQEDPVFNFIVGRAALKIKDDLGGGNPSISLQTGANIASGTSMTFTKARLSGGSIVAGGDEDIINTIHYRSYNDAGTPEIITFAQVLATIKDASDSDEAGAYEIKVATSDGSTSALQNAFSANGHGTNNIVSAQIGHGAASVVTVPGVLSALSGITFDGVALTTIQTSAESFVGNDTTLMTSAAIDNLIAFRNIVSDSVANTNFPVVFHDESNILHDDTGAFTYNPSTGTANIPIASIPKRKFAIPADGAGNADGDIVYIGTGSTVVGKIYYYKSDGSWGLTNSDDPGTATGWLAVALGTDPDADGMLLRGTIDLAENIVGTEALGSIIYLDKATAGAATTAAPTATGDIVRVIGYALTTGDANKIWFSPDNTWVEHV